MKYSLLLFLFVGLMACKEADNSASMSEEDLRAVTLAVSEALADETDGVMTELYDLQNNLAFGGRNSDVGVAQAPQRGPRPGQGDPRNQVRTYDPATGKHVIQFVRSFSGMGITKSQSVYLEYIFTNPDGAFIEFPGREEVAQIRFTGKREGSITAPRRSSTTSREATWLMQGMENASTTIRLNGTQKNSGSMAGATPNGDFSREFTLTLNFADVTLDKSFEADSTLETNVTGTITFNMTMKHTLPNGEIREKTNQGSIDLAGNGKALLRIMGIRTLFAINLATGNVES
jgi:hypothetical protein